MSIDRHSSTPWPDANPFSTRQTRPGALAFRFPPACQASDLIDRLREHHWWGQILGPHGSGKSTLLHSLQMPLHEAGRAVFRVVLHQGETQVAVADADTRNWDASTQVVVDGFEQLTIRNRAALKKACRNRGAGLLVTAHRSVGLPDLVHTTVSPELAQTLVAELLQPALPLLSAEDVAASYDRHQGNLREVFFELYDLYEARRAR